MCGPRPETRLDTFTEVASVRAYVRCNQLAREQKQRDTPVVVCTLLAALALPYGNQDSPLPLVGDALGLPGLEDDKLMH